MKGVTSKGVNADAAAVDITSDDDNGFQTFLDEAGKRGLNLDVSGVSKDDELWAIIVDPTTTSFNLTDVAVTDQFGNEFTGNFQLSNVSQTGATDGAVEFSATLQSNGVWTLTPPTP